LLWRDDRTGRRGFLLRQFDHGQFHGALNWNPRSAFGLIDNGVTSKRLSIFLARRFEFFLTSFGSLFFVIISARRWPNDGERHHTEEREKQNHAEPCRERHVRVSGFANGFGVGHVSSCN
jgi:hypothetical protein